MADIFISYSRNDSTKALALAEQLRASGMDVWIDQHGIEGATSWSKEIANALQVCHTMLLLLSPTAVASENVAKELSVATQLKKRIVPIQVIRTELEGEFLYHLTALQRVKIEDFDGIVRAINGTQPTTRPAPAPKPADDRKSLMILPFEDLSPTGDNQWFADGIVSELISALSNVKSLRLTDTQATKEFKNYKGQLPEYAATMQIRYFVQGDVRKFGDQIKISARLLDIETGDYLWQDSLKGTMNDIFDIQEDVARKVAGGLQVHLLQAEVGHLTSRGTQNPEAYEMYLKASTFYDKGSKVSVEHALKAIERSLELDPDFAQAMLRRAIILIGYYNGYSHDVQLLDEAETLLARVKEKISPADDWRVLGGPALLLIARGDHTLAESVLRENIALDPSDPYRHNVLAFLLERQGRKEEALVHFEAALANSPDAYRYARQIIGMAWDLDRPDLKREYARRFIHIFESRMKTMPEDDDTRVVYGLLLFYCGRTEEAIRHLDSIPDAHVTMEHTFRNLAALATLVGKPERAMQALRSCGEIDFGPQHVKWINESEFDSLREREDFIRLSEEWNNRLVVNG